MGNLLESLHAFGWIAAVVAVTYAQPWLAWLWVLVVETLGNTWGRLDLVLSNLSIHLPSTALQQMTAHVPFAWAITMLVFIVMLGSFLMRQRALAHGLFAVLILASLVNTLWRELPLDGLSLAGQIALSDFAELARGFWLEPARFRMNFGSAEGLGQLMLNLFSWNVECHLPRYCYILSPLINLSWILVEWLLIIGLALRPPRKKRECASG